jgi:hypothetical protein
MNLQSRRDSTSRREQHLESAAEVWKVQLRWTPLSEKRARSVQFGGLAFGLMMSIMTAPTPDGGEMNLMAMIGPIIGIPTVAAGWAYHLFKAR